MKKLFIIFLFSVMPLSNLLAKWNFVADAENGSKFYVDFDRIRKVDGFLYVWQLVDLQKETEGLLSVQYYYQIDCKLFRLKNLSFVNHKQPMAKGDGKYVTLKDSIWQYPPPGTVVERVIKLVCNH